MMYRPQQYPKFENLDQAIRSMTIVAGTLIAGVLVFSAFATYSRTDEPQTSAMALVLVLMVVGMAVALLIVPNQIVRNTVLQLDFDELGEDSTRMALAGIAMTRMINRMAPCEGAAFFANIVWMIEGNFIVLGILTAIVFVQLILFPTRHSLENWIDEQLEALRTENS
jgi:hypothetical protein